MPIGRTALLTIGSLHLFSHIALGLGIANRNNLSWSKHSETIQATRGVDFSCHLLESARQFQKGNRTFDLQSPRQWLEYCEIEDGRDGAYTVLRCDFHPLTKRWKIWGWPFHMDRLVSSFQSLEGPNIQEEISLAISATDLTIETLLEASKNSSLTAEDLPDRISDGVVTLMLTTLWVPSELGILVRGHAFHSGMLSVPSEYNPDPIIASVARAQNGRTNQRAPLPNRCMNSPESKLSSWCRQRSPLEEIFKLQDVGEVLLTRELENNDMELLEGLTSNLFIVYADGSLRTAPTDSSVLGGYARHLVLEHAGECGLQTRVGPLRLSESSQWKEVFTTSAIRLISPVSKIVAVNKLKNDPANVNILWSQRSEIAENPFWKRIYRTILAGEKSLDQ